MLEMPARASRGRGLPGLADGRRAPPVARPSVTTTSSGRRAGSRQRSRRISCADRLQPGRERGPAADRQVAQPPGGQLDRPGRRHHDGGRAPAEGQQRHPVAAPVGVAEQRQRGGGDGRGCAAGPPSTRRCRAAARPGWPRGRGAGQRRRSPAGDARTAAPGRASAAARTVGSSSGGDGGPDARRPGGRAAPRERDRRPSLPVPSPGACRCRTPNAAPGAAAVPARRGRGPAAAGAGRRVRPVPGGPAAGPLPAPPSGHRGRRAGVRAAGWPPSSGGGLAPPPPSVRQAGPGSSSPAPSASSSWAASSPGSSNGPAAAPVRQRQPGRLADVGVGHRCRAAATRRARWRPGRSPGRRACPSTPSARAGGRDPQQLRRRAGSTAASRARAAAMRAGRARCPAAACACGAGRRGAVVAEPGPDHLGPPGRVGAGHDGDAQPEPVQQLRPQLALLRVHGADQQEPAEACRSEIAFPLDARAAGGGGVQQHVDQVVGQQVDLVDVQHAAVGQRPAARARTPRRCRRPASTRGTSRLPVTRSSVAPSGSSTSRAGRCSAGLPGGCGPSGQPGSGVGRVAGEPALGHHADAGQDRRPGPAPAWSWRCPSRR